MSEMYCNAGLLHNSYMVWYMQLEFHMHARIPPRLGDVTCVQFNHFFKFCPAANPSLYPLAYFHYWSLVANKRDQPYSVIMAWLSSHFIFSFLKSAFTCLRGARSTTGYYSYATHHESIALAVSEGESPSNPKCIIIIHFRTIYRRR